MSNWQLDMPTPRAYAADKVLYDLHHKQDHLARYTADASRYLDDYALDDETRRAFLNNEIGRLYLIGANPYLIRAHCVGMRIPEAQSIASLKSAGAEATRG